MLKKVTIKDVPELRKLADIAFRDTYKTILTPDQIDYMMEWMYSESSILKQINDEGHVYYMEEGRGYVSFRPDGQTSDGRALFHLEKIYVLPDQKRSGLGRTLFNKIVSEAKALSDGKPVRIELNVNRNNPAVGFYERMGMKKAAEGDFPIGGGFYMNDYIYAIDL